jgi:hypothetical protein
MTVQRTPTRSAIRPIAIPPTAEPSQASEYDSAGHRADTTELGRDRLQRHDRD